MKRSKELSNEIINIVKNIAKKDEPSQVDKIVMEFDGKDAPENVKTVFDENLQRISEIDRNNPEFNIIM